MKFVSKIMLEQENFQDVDMSNTEITMDSTELLMSNNFNRGDVLIQRKSVKNVFNYSVPKEET